MKCKHCGKEIAKLMREIMSLPVPDIESARIQTTKINTLQILSERIEAEPSDAE